MASLVAGQQLAAVFTRLRTSCPPLNKCYNCVFKSTYPRDPRDVYCCCPQHTCRPCFGKACCKWNNVFTTRSPDVRNQNIN